MGLQLREYIVEKSAIPVGRACTQGSDSDRALLGITSNSCIGISINNGKLIHPVGDIIIIAISGMFWVLVESPVRMGDNVTANTTTGQLSSATPGSDQILISGAHWMTAQETANRLA